MLSFFEEEITMQSISLISELSRTSYPGRGIVIGKSADERTAVTAYFIMGRSENSRNRVFATDGEGIRTEAFDPSKMSDPSLIIYAPVRVRKGDTIVTNGDQTDTVYENMEKGETFEQSLRGREFEPDAPNYTPRISGVLHVADRRFSYELSILKSADGDPACCIRNHFSYGAPLAGEGRFLHTYLGDGDPLPSFSGEPTRVTIDAAGGIDAFADTVWNALDAENKVSLFVRFIDIASGKYETRLINKNR